MLRNHSYAINFESSAWQELFACGICREYHTGDIVIEQGGDCKETFFLSSGVIKHTYTLETGEEKTISYDIAPSIYGVATSYVSMPNPLSSVAATELQIFAVPGEVARDYFRKHWELADDLICMMVKRMEALKHQVILMHQSVPQRLCNFLLNMCDYGVMLSNETCPVFRHEDIATFLGISRPRVSQYLNEFRRLGFIECNRGQITVKDPETMKEYCYRK